jgi:hypothetical protein
MAEPRLTDSGLGEHNWLPRSLAAMDKWNTTRASRPMEKRTMRKTSVWAGQHGIELDHSRRVWRPVFLLAMGVVLAACSGNPAGTTTAAPSTTEASEAASPVEVTLVDFAFEGLPDTVPTGTQLTVTNVSDAEMHELVAFRLPEGEARSAADLAGLPPEELVGALGEPVTVLLAAPGAEQIPAVGDGTLTEPGNYAVFCFIPTGVDPQVYLEAAAESDGGPPQVEGGPPHFVNGMYADLTVEG